MVPHLVSNSGTQARTEHVKTSLCVHISSQAVVVQTDLLPVVCPLVPGVILIQLSCAHKALSLIGLIQSSRLFPSWQAQVHHTDTLPVLVG